MRLRISPAQFAAIGFAIACLPACKSASNASALRDTRPLPCLVQPGSTNDDLSVPTADQMLGCPDSTLEAEIKLIQGQVSVKEKNVETAETKSTTAKVPADSPTANPAPANGLFLAGSGSSSGLDDQTQRDLDQLKRDIQRLQDRAAALELELSRRRGRNDDVGICVYVRGGHDITSCNSDRTKDGCRAYVPTNSAYFFLYGKCEDFKLSDDFANLLDTLQGACVRVGDDRRVSACTAEKLNNCFRTAEDYSQKAFRTDKTCADYRTGDSFEGLKPPLPPQSQGLNSGQPSSQPGNNGAQPGATVATAPEVKTAFRTSCNAASGRPTDDLSAEDGMSCTCGRLKMSLRSFFNDYRDGNTRGYEDACRRAVRDNSNAQTSAPSSVAPIAPRRNNNNNLNSNVNGNAVNGQIPASAIATTNCRCGWDSAYAYCGIWKNGVLLSQYHQVSSQQYACGTTSQGTNDLCFTSQTLRNILNSADCR